MKKIIGSISAVVLLIINLSAYGEKLEMLDGKCFKSEVKFIGANCQALSNKKAHFLKLHHLPSNTVLIISALIVPEGEGLDSLVCRYLSKNKFSVEGIKNHLTSKGINLKILSLEESLNICSEIKEFPYKKFKTEL